MFKAGDVVVVIDDHGDAGHYEMGEECIVDSVEDDGIYPNDFYISIVGKDAGMYALSSRNKRER